MRTIYRKTYQRTLDEWCDRITREYAPSHEISVWLFEDEISRHEAEKAMRDKGFNVRFLSAVKPLLQFFREECPIDDLAAVKIRYPLRKGAVENRFKLEAYPLAGILDGLSLEFEPAGDVTDYYVELQMKDGRLIQHAVFCPNKYIEDWGGQQALTPCGWLRVKNNGITFEDHAIVTEFEQIFHDGMTAVTAIHPLEHFPYFEELNISVALPQREISLDYEHEVLSYQEMMHEEFYFSLLEYYQNKADLPSGDRSIQPGQIAPFIRQSQDGLCHIEIQLRDLYCKAVDGGELSVINPTGPLNHSAIREQLASIGGQSFNAMSRCGRKVEAQYVRGQDYAVLISGCQHGNETTGTVGALRAAAQLRQKNGAHFVVSPLENPDGNALFLRLLADNPNHMHHAARYTAYGNDLQNTPENSPAERGIRLKAHALSSAALHINLHGYPSHEWIRPLSGYIPRNFALWTLPKGFFVVFRYKKGWEQPARQLAQRVTQSLNTVAEATDLNEKQIKLYRKHAGELAFEMVNGIACSFTCHENAQFCVELITEHPDETIYNDDFRLGHELQMVTVLSAYTAWQEIYGQWHAQKTAVAIS